MLPTCRIHCAVFDNDGSPIAGAVVTAKLDRFEVYQGYVVPDIETATTDETGTCVLALWPNALGATASSYAVKIVAPNGRTQRLTVTVPNVADANLHEIAVLPPYEGKPDGQLAIEAAWLADQHRIAAESAATTATAAAQTATTKAGEASDSAAAALAAQGAAQTAATAAQGAQSATETARTQAQTSAAAASQAASTANGHADAAATAAAATAADRIQTGADAASAAASADRFVENFAQFATNLIRTQAIIAQNHGFN